MPLAKRDRPARWRRFELLRRIKQPGAGGESATGSASPRATRIRFRGRRWAGAVLLSALAGGAITLPAVSRANRVSAPTTLAVADAHLFSGDYEMELAITWTRPDCGAMERGQVCLRYSVIRDDRPIEVGYGLIPASAVHIGSGQVSLTVNTDAVSSPSFHRVNGSGGAINVVWNRTSVAPSVQAGSRISSLWTCSVQGRVAGFPLSGNGAHATILASSS